MKLYLIRHGETDWNIVKRLQGATDIPLNENGEALARETAEGLKEIPFDMVFTSPLKRAYRTAEIVKGNREIPLIIEERIREICFGDYEGLVSKSEGYNGNLTSAQNGSVGGYMVKKMIEAQERQMSGK